MAGLPIDVMTDVCDQVAAWQAAFLSESTLDRYRRACAWTMSGVAKGACQNVTAAVDVAFQDLMPWMRRAFGYTWALGKNRDEVEADVYTLPSQSIVMKYGMGDGPQIRRPGDVGLAKDVIYVPNWKNLSLTQGINRNSFGDLPGGVAARLAREALGERSKRQRPGRWGVYKGEVDVGGSRVMGYIARPPRGTAPIGKNGRSIVMILARLRALAVALEQATYEPIMLPPYGAAMRRGR
ncbi:hypothetical protein AO398_00100 [Methylobacterium sp. GXS13]|uniref:hypothetical protein n=1 Tax=Methylobacterium sp. GXS13 TaxID=1730094 RepID=UPI00071BAB9A|nr:hypothetical protein [Methylobacterium sp. GXS13]KST61128.1 hypothetical protein AO398_00100 [Methylobacterium sp. GXS13]